MSKKTPQNVAASVRQKLLNRARLKQEDFQLVLTQYALERLLFRLSQSKHAEHFILKGAFMFLIWTEQPYRATRDLDLLCSGESSTRRLMAVFRELCESSQNDGLIFEAESVTAEEIREEREYGGVRVTLRVRLEEAKIPLQIDIGFGDVITPGPEHAVFPTILDMPAPYLRTYSKESVIAEKYEAMVRFNIANSRMKDYYDVWVLARQFDFAGDILSQAIKATFERRGTPLPETIPLALSPDFSKDSQKQAQWKAFKNRTRLRLTPNDLNSIVKFVLAFVFPPTEALVQGKDFNAAWSAGGPWSSKSEGKRHQTMASSEGYK